MVKTYLLFSKGLGSYGALVTENWLDKRLESIDVGELLKTKLEGVIRDFRDKDSLAEVLNKELKFSGPYRIRYHISLNDEDIGYFRSGFDASVKPWR